MKNRRLILQMRSNSRWIEGCRTALQFPPTEAKAPQPVIRAAFRIGQNRRRQSAACKGREVCECPVHVAQRREWAHDQMMARVGYLELVEQPRSAIAVSPGCLISCDRERANLDDLPCVSQIQQTAGASRRGTGTRSERPTVR